MRPPLGSAALPRALPEGIAPGTAEAGVSRVGRVVAAVWQRPVDARARAAEAAGSS